MWARSTTCCDTLCHTGGSGSRSGFAAVDARCVHGSLQWHGSTRNTHSAAQQASTAHWHCFSFLGSPAEDQKKDLESSVQKLTDDYVKQVGIYLLRLGAGWELRVH